MSIAEAEEKLNAKAAQDGRAARGKSKRKKTSKHPQPSSRFVGKLDKQDQIVEWARPLKKPLWMPAELFASLPATLLVRELRYRITAKGMRSREVTIATTLLDPMRYPKRKIARLYKLRWEIETNFGHLKTTLEMEHLKCQTPNGVMKELMVFASVYNLVRAAMNHGTAHQEVANANRINFIASLTRCASIWTDGVLPGNSLPRLSLPTESSTPRPQFTRQN